MAKKVYYGTVFLLAVASIFLALFDLAGMISLKTMPYAIIDQGILLFFWVDYVARFTLAKDKKQFVKDNIFDLIAIIPFDSLFSVFRIARTVRLLKLFKVVRIFGFLGKIKTGFYRFMNTNGFIYLLMSAVVMILMGAGFYSVTEGISYANALWWAISTTTTVGYGDISPHSAAGKVIAVMLMVVGIGLIGSITSTITTFFTDREIEKEENDIEQRLTGIEETLAEIKAAVNGHKQ